MTAEKLFRQSPDTIRDGGVEKSKEKINPFDLFEEGVMGDSRHRTDLAVLAQSASEYFWEEVKDMYGDRKLRYDDIVPRWPEHLMQEATELSLIEQLRMIHLFKQAVAQMMSHHLNTHPDNITDDIMEQRLSVLARGRDRSGNMQKFVMNNADKITADTLGGLVGLDISGLTQKDIESTLAMCFPGQNVSSFLERIGHKKGVHVLGTRGSFSCYKTEHRLIAELRSGEASIIEYKRGSSKAVLAVKFMEATVAVCVQSDIPDFEPGMSYFPVGEIRKLLETEESHKDRVSVDMETTEDWNIWAKNRPFVGDMDTIREMMKDGQ